MKKRSQNRQPEGPNPVDVEVGRRVRTRRKALGQTQDELAKASGITFQQVQKYEHGVNRISASRLVQFATILDVPISYFFGEESRGQKFTEAGLTPEAVALAKRYDGVKSEEQRRVIRKTVAALSAGA